MNKTMSKIGFTLVELVAVIALLGILSSTAVPIYVNIVNESRASACQTNKSVIKNAWKLLSVDTPLLPDDDADIVTTLTDAEVISTGVACPSGGEYSLVDGEVFCSVHDASGEEETGTGGGSGGSSPPTPPPPSYVYQDASYTFTATPEYGGNFGYTLAVYNNSAVPIYGWIVEFDYPGTLSSAYTATLTSLGGNRYRLTCKEYNHIISVGGSSGTGGRGSNYSGSVITNVVIKKTYETINSSAHMSITNSWAGGYNFSVSITNNSNMPIMGWTLEFTYPGTITSTWNGTLTSLGGNRYRVQSPTGSNITIPANGGSVSFGGQGSGAFVGNPTGATLNGEAITFN